MTSSRSLAQDSIFQFLGHHKIIQRYSKLLHKIRQRGEKKTPGLGNYSFPVLSEQIDYNENDDDNTNNTNNQMGATTAQL